MDSPAEPALAARRTAPPLLSSERRSLSVASLHDLFARKGGEGFLRGDLAALEST